MNNNKKDKLNNDKTIIGVVGLNASGKDEVVKRLNEKYGVPIVSTGDITREIAKEEGIKPTRDNLHGISQKYIKQYGPEYYPKRVIKKIEAEGWEVVGVTGIRTPIDASTFQNYYGNNFVLIYVEVSDSEIRFKRAKKRFETRDPLTLNELLEQDKNEEKLFHLSKTISMATVMLNNDGTLEEFQNAIDKLAEKYNLMPKAGL